VEASRTRRRFRRRARPAPRRYGGVRESIRDTARKTRYPGSRSLDARTQNLLEGARWLGFAPLSPVGIRAGESKRWPVFFPGGLISLEARIVDRDTLAQQEIFYDLPVSLGDR
jgi:hypothetical protein